MAQQHDMAVFIGRFQPIHLGHMSVIETALEHAKHLLILVGSSNAPRSHRNPFTFDERKSVIYHSVPGHLRDRVKIKSLEDAAYNDTQWTRNVQQQATAAAWEFGYTSPPKVVLIGHSKDSTSYYLNMFPQWQSNHIEVPNFRGIDSTRIRNVYFSNIGSMWLSDADGHKPGDLDRDAQISTHCREFLADFIKTPAYANIGDEYEFITKYKLSWSTAPYPPTFVTADSIVVQSGHVLLVRRKALPGKGLWAMPGGFINQNERIKDAAIRELREETGLKVPEKVLRGSIVAQDVFDDPNRSARGRTITHCFMFKLEDGPLPKVKGLDDADKAWWEPVANLKRDKFFEDHYDILDVMINARERK